MSDRIITGAVAVVAAILTCALLFWMFQMMSPAAVVGGHANGAVVGSLIAAWFWLTFTVLVASAIILLMTRRDNRA